MKKLIALFAALILCFSVAACTDSTQKGNETSGTSSTVPTTPGITDLKIDQSIFSNSMDPSSETILYNKKAGIISDEFNLSLKETADIQLPVFINNYYFDQGGPTFELNDDVKNRLITNFYSFTTLLGYSDRDISYNIDNGFILQSTISGDRFISGVNHISIKPKEIFVSNNTSLDDVSKLLDENKYMSAAYKFLEIKTPVIEKREYYNNNFQLNRIEFTISESEPGFLFQNKNLQKIVLVYYPVEEIFTLFIDYNDFLEHEKELTSISYNDAIEKMLKDDSNIKKENIFACEIFYSVELMPGYYVPCYKFYIDKGSAQNQPTTTDNTKQETSVMRDNLNLAQIYCVAAVDISVLKN